MRRPPWSSFDFPDGLDRRCRDCENPAVPGSSWCEECQKRGEAFFEATEPDGPFDPEALVDAHLAAHPDARCACAASPETRRRLDLLADALTTPADDEEAAA